MKRVAIYARVSTKQREQDVENQPLLTLTGVGGNVSGGLCYTDRKRADDLEGRLFPASEPLSPEALPDWNTIHREYKKKGVTLQLLWQEYRLNDPTGFQTRPLWMKPP